ncbi:MAG: TrmH family RNA methyltransferase [Myxococcota bacterium]
MQRISVTDFEDPRLDDYRNLKDAELLAKRARFIAEGTGVLRVLLGRSAYQPDSILLSERRFRTLEEELGAFDPACPVYVVPQAVMDEVVGFPIHRGCLAAVPRGEARDPLSLARELLEAKPNPRLVILEGMANLDNVGGIFRNAMGLGGDAVLLCPRCCDPLYRKAIRTSMGGTLCVPFGKAENLVELLRALRALGYAVWAFDPTEPATNLGMPGSEEQGPLALLFGTEGPGLTPAALAEADLRVRIPMEAGVDSLNVAAAAGIGLFSTRRL